MSIKLRFEKGSIDMRVILKDDALPELMALISEHESDEAAPPTQTAIFGERSADSTGDQSVSAKAWLSKHSAAEVLNKIKWITNPDKILLMGAFHESKVKTDSWRSADMESRFAEAKDTPPANFPRDISTAIKSGLIATVTPRTYIVSRTGWNKIADAIAKIAP
ncbi:MAG: hypothetical protein ABSF51_03405 [Verrucomicrobiota bacterium]|jgi:hypothetical protein